MEKLIADLETELRKLDAEAQKTHLLDLITRLGHTPDDIADHGEDKSEAAAAE